MIQGTNIHKAYGNIQVLKGVDIEVQKGEVVSIVGPSGSGKSTLLHILGTLDKADEGQVIVDDTDVQQISAKKLAAFRNKNIGFVFQFHHLLPEFSALENVCIPGWLAGRKKKEVESDARDLLGILNVAHRASNKPAQLSGGEQQRIAIARALINRPSIVFADEPTGNLDTANAKEFHELIFDLRKRFGQTFLIVTHNEDLACLSDRALQLKDGMFV